MNEVLSRLFQRASREDSDASGCWRPAADIYRTDSGWLVKLDLAGVTPAETELDLQGRRLIVRGTRRDGLVQQGLCSYSLEINYNRFERWVELPARIDQYEVKTEYRDGMLLVWLQQQTTREGSGNWEARHS